MRNRVIGVWSILFMNAYANWMFLPWNGFTTMQKKICADILNNIFTSIKAYTNILASTLCRWKKQLNIIFSSFRNIFWSDTITLIGTQIILAYIIIMIIYIEVGIFWLNKTIYIYITLFGKYVFWLPAGIKLLMHHIISIIWGIENMYIIGSCSKTVEM